MDIKKIFRDYRRESILKFSGMKEIEFLCGIDESDTFETTEFEKYIKDVRNDMKGVFEHEFHESSANSSYKFSHEPIGTILWKNNEIVGYYYGPTLAIDDEHQGQGLGTELVVRHALHEGEPPQYFYDEPMYSDAGLSCHISAFNVIAELVEMAKKQEIKTKKSPNNCHKNEP